MSEFRRAPDDAADARRARRRKRHRGPGYRQLRAAGLTLLAATLLILLTILTFAHLPRYEPAGATLTDNLDFRDGFRGWETAGIITLDEVELGRVILQNRDPERSVYLRRTIELPPGRTAVLLSAEVASTQVQPGEEPWQTARIYLVQETRAGEWVWNQPNRLVELVGDSRRHRVAHVFEIPATIDRVMLGIELPYATGQFAIANLRLAVVDELPGFRLAATLLVAAWCLLGAWVVERVMRGLRSPKLRVLLGATATLLALGAFMPSTIRQHVIDSFASGLGLDAVSPDALGHAVAFAVLALLVRSGRRHDPLLLHLGGWLLAGAAIEVLQLLTADRSPEASDWFADAAGAVLGLTLAEIGFRLERWLAPPKKPRPERPLGERPFVNERHQ